MCFYFLMQLKQLPVSLTQQSVQQPRQQELTPAQLLLLACCSLHLECSTNSRLISWEIDFLRSFGSLNSGH